MHVKDILTRTNTHQAVRPQRDRLSIKQARVTWTAFRQTSRSDLPNKQSRRPSIGPRPSLPRPGPTHESEEARREERPLLSLPTDERQGQANQALLQQAGVSRSTRCSQNRNSAKVWGLSFIVSNFRPPCLVNRS